MTSHNKIHIAIPSKGEDAFANLSIFDTPTIRDKLMGVTKSESEQKYERYQKTLRRAEKSKAKSSFLLFAKERRTYKCSRVRNRYIEVNEQLKQMLIKIEDGDCLSVKETFKMKESIYKQFMEEYISEVSKQNLDQAQTVVVIWSNLLKLIEKAVEKLCHFMAYREKENLTEIISTHDNYQNMLEKYRKQIEEQKEKIATSEHFTKILVSKLRQYKREIKKLDENMRIAADKLNQFRQGYLEIQIQFINMTMESRNIGVESAKAMVERKMALSMEKQKKFKIMQSKKKLKKQMKDNPIGAETAENVRMTIDLFQSFKANNEGEKQSAVGVIVGRLIDTVLDGDKGEPMNYSIFNENLVQTNCLEQGTADKETDMQGFLIETGDKKVGINYHDRLFEQMSKIKGVQTLPIQKPPPIITANSQVQCNPNQIQATSFSIVKTVDRSFLFQSSTNKSRLSNKSQVMQIRSSLNEPKPSNPSSKGQSSNSSTSKRNLKQKTKTLRRTNSFSTEKSADLNVVEVVSQVSNEEENQQLGNSNNENQEALEKMVSTFGNLVEKKGLKIRKKGMTSLNKKNIMSPDSSVLQRNSRDSLQNRNSEGNSASPNSRKKQSLRSNSGNQSRNSYLRKGQRRSQFVNGAKSNEKAQRLSQHNELIIPKRTPIKKSKKSSLSYFNKIVVRSSGSENEDIEQENVNNLSSVFSTQKKQEIITKLNKQEVEENIRNSRKSGYEKARSKPVVQEKNNFQAELVNVRESFEKEISQFKMSGGRVAENSNKIYDMVKIIEMAFQLAYKEKIELGKTKQFECYICESIKISYRVINTFHLRKKMVSFVKQLFIYRAKNHILRLSLLMLGINEQGEYIPYFINSNNSICLTIMKELSLNWKIPLKFEKLKIDTERLQENLRRAMKQLRFSEEFVGCMVKYVSENCLQNFKGKSSEIFELCQDINEFIIKKQSIILNSFQPLMTLIEIDKDLVPRAFLVLLINLHFFTRKDNRQLMDKFNLELDESRQTLKKGEVGLFCCQMNLSDFYRLFYRTLGIFRLKQNEDMFKSIDIKKLRNFNLSIEVESLVGRILEYCAVFNERTELFHSLVKKNFLILLYLKKHDVECDNLLKVVIGPGLSELQMYISKNE